MRFKWLKTPVSNETKETKAIEMWEVRWWSRRGQFHGDTRPEVECFPSREEADAFALAIANAFRLIRHTSGNLIEVKKAGT